MRKTMLSLMLMFSLISMPLYPQGFRNPPEGVRSLSQGCAFTAQADNASAVSHNPAGIVHIEGQEIIIGLTAVVPSVKFEGAGASGKTEDTTGLIPYLFYVNSLKSDSVSFGLSITSPYGQSTEWSKTMVSNWGTSFFGPIPYYNVPYHASMRTVNISPVLAFRLSENLSAGGGVNIYQSTVNLNLSSALPGNPAIKTEADGTAGAASAGLFYKGEKFSAGLNYKGGFSIDYNGKMKSSLIPGGVMPYRSEINFPDIVALGLAYKPNPLLKVEFDAEWAGYSCVKEINGEDADWNDVYNFYLGTRYSHSSNVDIMGGIAYIKSPVPDATFKPFLPDADRIMLSTGTEITTKAGIIGLALNYNIFQERKIRGGDHEGRYKPESYLVTLEYRKNF